MKIYPKSKIKFDKMFNGYFARCPKCGKTTARNACGYWVCLCGCGHEFKVKK